MFSIKSMDWGYYFPQQFGSINVIGRFADDSILNMPLAMTPGFSAYYFTSEWTNLLSVSFKGYAGFDNIVVESVSPVPLACAPPLSASALGLGGLIGWRRKRKAAMVTL